MTAAHREHPQATDELLNAIRYYHRERAGLGDEFATRARAAVQDVLDSPNAWPPLPSWHREPVLRSRTLQVFPYRVVYYVRDGEITIVAYAHERRRPGYWQQRLTPSEASGQEAASDSPDS